MKIYENPEIVVMDFMTEDIIATSDGKIDIGDLGGNDTDIG